MLAARGLQPTLESELAVGGFWQSTGLAAAAGALAEPSAGVRAAQVRPRQRSRQA